MDQILNLCTGNHPSLITNPLDGAKKLVPFGKPIDVMQGIDPQYQCATVVRAEVGKLIYYTSTGEFIEIDIEGHLREMTTQRNMRLTHMFWSEGSKITVVFDLNHDTGVIQSTVKDAADCKMIGYTLCVGVDDLNRRPR